MTPDTQVLSPTDVSTLTPSDGVQPPKKERKPRQGSKVFKLFDDGGGDFRLYEIVAEGDSRKLPAGVLVPVPGFGGFESAIEVQKAVRASGEKLTGKQVLIMRGIQIIRIELQTQPRVMIQSKPRRAVGATGVTQA